MKTILATIVAISLAGVSSTVTAAPAQHAYRGHELAKMAKITMAQARTIALKSRHGTVTDAELEREAGGSGLRYSFDIRSHGRPFEVGVDAISGAVLENKAEGRHPD
ncbi:MAG: PepSY domain-containing protein [Novosphingobium sp.]